MCGRLKNEVYNVALGVFQRSRISKINRCFVERRPKMAKVNLTSLNKVLPYKADKKTKKRHVSSGNRNDPVSQAMAKCEDTAAVATLGMKFGLTEKEVRSRARTAPNFGQYRMVIGNRVRGIVRRIRAAKKRHKTLSPAEAAYPGAKAVANPSKPKVTKKKAKKARRR